MNKDAVLSWDEYFIGVAILSSKRSKDPSTRVGACIVNKENRIVGVGYNGFPNMPNNESSLPWSREGEFLDTKYPYVVHAEVNAILNATTKLNDCTIYVSLFPCNECAKAIIQSGIKEVVYLSDKYSDTDSVKASKKLLELCRVSTRQIVPFNNSTTIDFY
ncbi:MAG: deoxycytidylate deaminase [Paraclostridium sp.]